MELREIEERLDEGVGGILNSMDGGLDKLDGIEVVLGDVRGILKGIAEK